MARHRAIIGTVLDLLLTLTVLLLVVAIWLQLRQRPGTPASGASSQRTTAPVRVTSAKQSVSIRSSLPGHLVVLSHHQLLQVTGAHHLLEHLERHSCLAREAFERDLLPAVQRFAEFVQLMPASESHHHANVGGLLAHALETTYHALVLRAGYLLPRNGGAEIVSEQRDYWTYAVFIAALLHDVGKPLTDMRIEMRRAPSSQPTRWLPIAGSLNECKAEQYLVNFAPRTERDYGAHSRLGAALMQRIVPVSALSFLGRCPEVLQELTQYLAGESKQGAIAEIVSKADQLSTKNNLEGGSRARFATARSVPLIEQLMGAMHEMLRQGGQLPLNRDGASGWVYDGSVWFVAKRLADSVREHIVARGGDEAGIPGEAKNDRLFDCWQEYGQLMPNPVTQQAVWHVVVHGDDGDSYSHKLSVLRFPLEKLWPEGTSTYPPPMAGRLEVLEKRKTEQPGDGEPVSKTTIEEAQEPPPPRGRQSGQQVPKVRAPRFAQGAGKADKDDAAVADEMGADFLRDDESASEVRGREEPSTTESHGGQLGASIGAMPAGLDGSARAVLLRRAPATGPVREPSETAQAFMRWVQQGLTDGSLKYNEAGAPVHFVEAGMALISPAIFRVYALRCGEPTVHRGLDKEAGQERVGLAIQREVLRAGWHTPNPVDNTNIWTFHVIRRGGVKVSKLSAVVLADPRRWVTDPPPANPALKPLHTDGGGNQSGK